MKFFSNPSFLPRLIPNLLLAASLVLGSSACLVPGAIIHSGADASVDRQDAGISEHHDASGYDSGGGGGTGNCPANSHEIPEGCECNTGYHVNAAQNGCEADGNSACPPHSHVVTDGCECDTGYHVNAAHNACEADGGNTNVTPGCNGECGAMQYTACTCDVSDPCHWMADGDCDHDSCVNYTNTPFNDVNDCGGDTTTGPSGCGSDCGSGTVNACTCATSDPCGWESDGTCQRETNEERIGCEDLVGATGAFNDSKDCSDSHIWDPTPIGNETFYVTSMDVYESQLDNGDLDIFVSSMPGLGFSNQGQNLSVSESSLSNALAQNYTMLYHTGHGDSGMVMIDSYGNALTPSSGQINVQHTIFATCLTLANSWASAFGSGAQTIFGYTLESIDAPVDDNVVRDFASYLRNGQDYVQAWYSSNISEQYLYDRWAANVREGGSIVEYSARSGKNPSRVSASTAAQPRTRFAGHEKLSVTTSVLEDHSQFSLHPEQRIDLPAQAQSAQFADQGWAKLGVMLPDNAASEKQALTFINEAMDGQPADLGEFEMLDLAAGEDGQSAQAVGRIVRFGRSVLGLPLRSNLNADQITVLLGQDGVVSWSRSWPQRVVKPFTGQSLEVQQALNRAADGIAKRLKTADTIISVNRVWGIRTGQRELRPAFEFIAESGLGFVVDAMTGELL